MNNTPKQRSWWVTRQQRWLQTIALFAAAALAACGGGANVSTPTVNTQACSNCGGVMMTLTDAPGDFISYIVKVDSLQLKRADGTVVETVPVTTQVNFAQLVNLSEILSAKQIPAGNYVSASITLDYAGATIVVDNGTTGVTIPAANIVNGATSMPLMAPNSTQVTVTLSLASNEQLVVTPGTVANLALDFNLAASNAITPSSTNPMTVTVNPVLAATLVPDTTKQIRVRGSLVSVNTTGNSYRVNVRPFDDDGDADDGQFTVQTTSTTTYAINGTAYTGSAGLTQLASLTAGTMTAAFGSWNKSTQTFTATNVLAGSSVAGTMHDSVEGTVIARAGNSLTVANDRMWHAAEDGEGFADQVIVTVGTATTVTEDGQSGSFTIQDISVGQHLQLSGTFGKDSAGNTTLDATSGSARLMLTGVWGTVTTTAANLVTLNLQALDGRGAASFNFAGTGSTQDATAAAYTVSVPSALSTTGLGTGLPARFFGFVSPFGQAPPDFSAVTLVNFGNTVAELRVRWMPGTTMPFATLTNTELLVSQATLQASALHVVMIGPASLDPSSVSAGLQIVPDASATDPDFAVGHLTSENFQTFSTFSDFVTALTGGLNGTTTAVQIAANGTYNSTTGVLTVSRMIVVLDN